MTEVEQLRTEVERLRGLLKEAGTALVSLTPNGSEYYLRDGDGFRVDVKACIAFIRRKNEDQHRMIVEGVKARKALAIHLSQGAS